MSVMPMSFEDKFCAMLGIMIRLRALGASGRTLAKAFVGAGYHALPVACGAGHDASNCGRPNLTITCEMW